MIKQRELRDIIRSLTDQSVDITHLVKNLDASNAYLASRQVGIPITTTVIDGRMWIRRRS